MKSILVVFLYFIRMSFARSQEQSVKVNKQYLRMTAETAARLCEEFKLQLRNISVVAPPLSIVSFLVKKPKNLGGFIRRLGKLITSS